MNAQRMFRQVAVFVIAAAFAGLSLGLLAQATPPGLVNYQGVLRDASGNPLSGLQTMTFRFYDAASGGTVLWEETYSASYPPQVTVSTGLFTVALGGATHRTNGSETLFPNVFAHHAGVYLAVAVGSDAEMTPRIQAVSAPFAENATSLGGRAASEIPVLALPNTWDSTQTFNGNIGIGTAAGTWPLTVQGGQAVAQLVSTSAAFGSVLELRNTTMSPTLLGAINFNNAASTYPGQITYLANDTMAFNTANTNRMSIDSSGNVGIGAAPSTDRLYVQSTASGKAYLGSGDVGIDGYGNVAGGYFKSANASGEAYLGYSDDGIKAFGNEAGGYFKDANASGHAYVGYGDYGVYGAGNTAGGAFDCLSGGSTASVAHGNDGIDAYGKGMGGYFVNNTSGTVARVADATSKISGTGEVSFVQNHPVQKDKVIVYACPEGDEVATYTRGTAKLVNGEARVQLGETFKWVTNPDIGLTAHLTPHGEAVPLAVESLSTTELVVKGPKDGPANLAFDYIVYGLRIGFEESSIVQEKQQESFIPSFNDHRERYAKYPELRAFNSLERFKKMESSVSGVPESSIDLSRAKALHDAIHEYDPATDPPVEKLFGFRHGAKPNDAAPASGRPALPSSTATGPLGNGGILAPAASSGPAAGAIPVLPVDADGNVYGKSFRPASADFAASFPVCGPVEAGDVLVTDANHPGAFCRSLVPNDPGVVGVVAGEPGVLLGSGPKGSEPAMLSAPVATSGIVKAKVDAGYGPIALNDLLVVSPTPGHAMRADNPAQGTVIGKALEPFATGTGTIKVLVMLR